MASKPNEGPISSRRPRAPAREQSGGVSPYFVAATLGIVALVTLAFFWTWRYGFTCDHAISGLMAKSILRRGERPLFLWTLGYNGILLESYAVALSFQLFGHGPHVYYLPTLLCFWGLVYLFYAHVRDHCDGYTALLAVLFFVVSAPRVYFYVLRPQPNYTEIFVLGLLLLGIARRLIGRLYVGPKAACSAEAASQPRMSQTGQTAPGLAALFGLCLGFALYTYQLIFFFLGALGLYVMALYVHDGAARAKLAEGSARTLRRVGLCLLGVAAFVFVLSAILFFAGDGRASELVAVRSAFRLATLLSITGVTLEYLPVRLPAIRRQAFSACMALFGVAIGYSPSLIFTYWLHGHSRDRLRVSLSPEQVRHSFWLFIEAQRRFLNAWDSTIGSLLGLAVLAAALWAVANGIGRLAAVARHRAPLADCLSVSPLLLLPIVSVPLFCFAAAAEDWESARWTIGLSLFFALAQAMALRRCWGQGGAVRSTAAAVAVAVLLHNAMALCGALGSQEAKAYRGEELVAPLRARQITRAYADYWYAYSIDLMTDEEIIIEPLYNNYSPHYAATVREASRIALIDEVGPRLRAFPQQVQIGSNVYRRTDAWFGRQAGFVVLERL